MLAIEIEEDNAATRPITNPIFYNSPYSHDVSYGDDRGKAPKGEGKAARKGDRPKGGVCFDMLQHGKCERENCRYSHDKKALAAAREEKGRKGAAVAAVDAADPDWTAKAYQKGQGKKGKSKGKGEEGKEKWPGKGKISDPESKKHILCKFKKKERNVLLEERHVRSLIISKGLRHVILQPMLSRHQERLELLLRVLKWSM